MKLHFLILLSSLFLSGASISESPQEPQELKEASELSESVVRLFKEGKLDEALPLAKRALEIRERLLPRTDARLSTSLSYLGDLYIAKHDYNAAKKTFERLLAIQEEQFGPTDVNLGFTFDRLAVLYNREGSSTKAEDMYQRALAVRDKALGPDNIEVADAWFALAQFYRSRGRYDRALVAYKESLSIYGRATGPATPAFERASTGLSCLAYESQNLSILKDLEAIQKQLAPAIPPPKPASLMNGKAVSLAKPEYPKAAIPLRLSGTVVVHVDIDEEGRVTSAKDVCEGLPYLSESAVKAALKSRFSPTILSGQPAKVKGVIHYVFVAPVLTIH